MKILLNYNPETGNINDPVTGVAIVTYMGLAQHKLEQAVVGVKDLLDLKEAGFTTEEIVELNKKVLINE